jgi:hypothetical protein
MATLDTTDDTKVRNAVLYVPRDYTPFDIQKCTVNVTVKIINNVKYMPACVQ